MNFLSKSPKFYPEKRDGVFPGGRAR